MPEGGSNPSPPSNASPQYALLACTRTVLLSVVLLVYLRIYIIYLFTVVTLHLQYRALKRIQTGAKIFESQHNTRILIQVIN